jgi:hypothetical protein
MAEDASRKFDIAQFEVNDPRGIFDRDFHEILFPRFKKRAIFSHLEFQPKIRAVAIYMPGIEEIDPIEI